MKKHVEEKHCTAKQKLCIYSNSLFSETKTFIQHLQHVHSLPSVTQTQNSQGKLPQASAFGRTVQTYFIEANVDHDLLQFMVDRKQLFDENIEEDVRAQPKKVQLSAKIILKKPVIDEDAIDLMIHVNSKKTVYLGERLTKESFFTMLDQILSSLFSFISHGSRWMLKDINGFYVKLVSYVPIRGSAYLALPCDLQIMECLLNIRIQEDNNCFLYCYEAAWHLAYGQSLFAKAGWRMRMKSETYSPSHPMTHQPVGDFEMPMAFNQIRRFENLNKVQINLFRYQKKDLIPTRILKQQELPLILNLLLLSDGQAYHYVFIEYLKTSVSNLKQQATISSNKFCRNCFQVRYKVETYWDLHAKRCSHY